MTVKKRMAVPSVLVDCRECGEPFEISQRDFELSHQIDPDPSWPCDDCKVLAQPGGGE